MNNKFLKIFLLIFVFLYGIINSSFSKENNVNIKKVIIKKHESKNKSSSITVKKINSKNLASSCNVKKTLAQAKNYSPNEKIFYLNGQKLSYQHEMSPSGANKLNNFCFLAVDGKSGDVLFAKNPNEKCYPASLTKLMTLYILFEQLASKKLKMNSRIYFSKASASKQRSKLGVAPGDSISVFEAIQSLIILSANDTAAAVGEKISGSEAKFGELMTRKARELGMSSTSFQNASGLFHPNQKTTAIDLVRLGIAIKRDFPQYYHLFSKTSFNFRGRTIYGHNSITRDYEGAEGLKTGFVRASGFNIVSSATRDGRTIFAAVLGAGSKFQRDEYMKNLLDQSFSKLSSSKRRDYRNKSNSQRKNQFSEEYEYYADNERNYSLNSSNYQLVSYQKKDNLRRNFVAQ